MPREDANEGGTATTRASYCCDPPADPAHRVEDYGETALEAEKMRYRTAVDAA